MGRGGGLKKLSMCVVRGSTAKSRGFLDTSEHFKKVMEAYCTWHESVHDQLQIINPQYVDEPRHEAKQLVQQNSLSVHRVRPPFRQIRVLEMGQFFHQQRAELGGKNGKGENRGVDGFFSSNAKRGGVMEGEIVHRLRRATTKLS